MNTQDKSKNLLTDLSKPTQSLPNQSYNQNRSSNTQASTAIVPNQTNVSGANMSNPSKGKKIQRGNGGRNYFPENSIDRYFVDLLKKIRENYSFLKLKAEMVSSNELMRWLREGLDEFKVNPEKSQQYQQKYKGKSFLSLRIEEIGFGRATLMPGPHAKKIDIIIDKSIQMLTKQTASNHWLITKILRKYLRQGKFYPSLYQAQISNEVFKPNPKIIDKYFVSPDSEIINESSTEYSELLAKCIQLYFQQYNACILCLQSFVQLQFEQSFRTENRQILEGLLTRTNAEKPLGLVLWQNYCALSDSILNQPEGANVTQNVNANKMRQKCKEVIQQKKIKVFMYLALLFQRAANQNVRIQRELASSIKDFSETAILRIDNDITKIQASGKIVSLHVSLLIRKLTELMLAIFPWKSFQEQKNSTSQLSIKKVVQKTVSNPFKPIRIIVQFQNNKAQQAFIKINQQLQNGDWAIHSYQWKKWLGIFLKKFNTRIQRLARYPYVMKHIVWLCKTVMKEECDQFWQQEKKYKKRQMSNSQYIPHDPMKQNISYLLQILFFLQKVIRDDISHTKGISITQCFCILTSSLGIQGKNHIKETLRFMNQSNSQVVSLHIKQSITASLSLQERSADRNTRIVYSQAEKQKNIEQELKFLCRIVEIGTQAQLTLLQQYLFQDSGENSQTGFAVIVFLCKIFQRLSPDCIHDIKCLRYIIRALDAIFIDLDTRTFLPIALGATQIGKWSCGKTIRQIIDICTQTKGPFELIRQAKKLRSTFGLHINNILKISNSIHEYFPSGSRRQDEKMYEKLQSWLKLKEFHKIKTDFLQTKKPPLKYVPWLHNFLLILQSNKLTAVDLQNIHQLLLKMRVERCTAKEFTNMQLIVQMMNNGSLQVQVAKILTPIVVSKQSSRKYLFGLANNKFQSFISISDPLDDVFKVQSSNQTKLYEYIANAHSKRITTKVQTEANSPNKISIKVKYSSKQYRLAKQNYRRERQIAEIYEEISNCLRVIQTVLRLNFEGEFELMKKLTLAKWVNFSFLQKSHFYTVPFTVQLESQVKQSDTLTSKQQEIKLAQHELTTSINIIHTIASLLDFQERFEISQTLHPTYKTKLKGNCYFEISIWDEHQTIDKKTVERIQKNLLAEQPTRNNISISILQILQHLINLNYEKKAFYCLTNRIYPQNKTNSNSLLANKILEQFFVCIMSIIIRSYSSIRTREICLSFLCSCMKSTKFSQFIRSKAYNYKQPLIYCLQFLNQEGGMAMITKMLLFLNLILSDRPQIQNLMFVKSCLQDIIGFGSNLGNLTQIKLRQFKASPKNNSPYQNMLWSKRAHQIIQCKMSLLLYLALLSIFINTQSQYLVPPMVQWLLRQSQICTQIVTQISYQKLAVLQQGSAKKMEEIIKKRSQKGYLQFTQQLHSWLLFEGQGSLGEDFVCRRWQAYHKALQKQDPGAIDYVIIALRINNQYSIQIAQSALSQLYFTVLLGLFQRGKNGYYFIEGRKSQNQKMTYAISPHGERSSNSLSGIQLVKERPQNIRRIFTLVNNILNEVWKDKVSNQNITDKNNAILLLAEVLKMIYRCYQSDQNSWLSFDSESAKVISKIEGHLWGSIRINNQKVCVCLLQSVLQLNTKINKKGVINGSAESIKKYLNIIINNYQQVLQKMEIDSILKLGIQIQQMQINILIQIENNKKIMRSYLGCEQHRILILQIRNCLEIALKVIEDKSTIDGILSFAILCFTKCLQISSLIKEYYIESISKEFSHRLATRLEYIALDKGEQQQLSGLFLLSFMAQASASGSNEWNRMIVKILNDNTTTKVGGCGNAQSLWNLIENKLILQSLVNMSSIEYWHSKQTGFLLTQAFVSIQQQIHKFFASRVTPTNQIQHQLANRIVVSSQRFNQIGNFTGSIYNFLVELRMHQNVRYFLLFLLSSLSHCPLLAQFCQKSISTGPLQEHTWQRIKLTLQHISQFIIKFMQTSIEYKKQIIDVSVAISSQASFASISLRAFFDLISSETQLFEDCYQTLMIFVQSVNVFVRVWRSYDWKSRLGWKESRKQFVVKCLTTVNKWREMMKRIDSQNKMKQKLQRLIYVLNECQNLE